MASNGLFLTQHEINKLRLLSGYERVEFYGRFFRQTRNLQDVGHWIFSVGEVRKSSETLERGCFVITTTVKTEIAVKPEVEYFFQKTFFLLERLLGVDGFYFREGLNGAFCPFPEDLRGSWSELCLWMLHERMEADPIAQDKRVGETICLKNGYLTTLLGIL